MRADFEVVVRRRSSTGAPTKSKTRKIEPTKWTYSVHGDAGQVGRDTESLDEAKGIAVRFFPYKKCRFDWTDEK